MHKPEFIIYITFKSIHQHSICNLHLEIHWLHCYRIIISNVIQLKYQSKKVLESL